MVGLCEGSNEPAGSLNALILAMNSTQGPSQKVSDENFDEIVLEWTDDEDTEVGSAGGVDIRLKKVRGRQVMKKLNMEKLKNEEEENLKQIFKRKLLH
ncbi:hypothetical protein ANN_24621 [Periplaneta americana]|uniref:Uncharacterized protein n=1 Tax=Periplaneta americana TaxID=6978 RepID=A0ABQ8S3J8_PERAM|nr:hypothetical protein ANN_24621 [Periplaneta americana]